MEGLPGLWACSDPLYADQGGSAVCTRCQLRLQLRQNWVSACAQRGGALSGLLTLTHGGSAILQGQPQALVSHMQTEPPLSVRKAAHGRDRWEKGAVKPDAGAVSLGQLPPTPLPLVNSFYLLKTSHPGNRASTDWLIKDRGWGG